MLFESFLAHLAVAAISFGVFNLGQKINGTAYYKGDPIISKLGKAMMITGSAGIMIALLAIFVIAVTAGFR